MSRARLLSVFEAFVPGTEVAQRNSSSDGVRSAFNGGGGGEDAVLRHERRIWERVCSRVHHLVRARVRDRRRARRRTGGPPRSSTRSARTSRPWNRAWGRSPRSCSGRSWAASSLLPSRGLSSRWASAGRGNPRGSPSARPRPLTFHPLPNTVRRHPEHDKWRWLSSLRALKGFDEFEKTLETVYGIHLSSSSVLMAMKKLERSNFAMVGDMVTPGRLYRDKELIGAIGTVIKSCPRGRDVRWTTRDGKTFEEFSRLAMLKGFSSDNNPICDRCRRGDQNSCQSCRLKREREGGGDAEEPVGKRARKAPKFYG